MKESCLFQNATLSYFRDSSSSRRRISALRIQIFRLFFQMVNRFDIKETRAKYHKNSTNQSKTGDMPFEMPFQIYIQECKHPLKNYNRHRFLAFHQHAVFQGINDD